MASERERGQRYCVVRIVFTNRGGKQVNKEYLEAKFDLCINEAEKDLQQEEIARAIANLKRANSALSQLFGFEEDESE
jgi:uncharacterized protein YwgA